MLGSHAYHPSIRPCLSPWIPWMCAHIQCLFSINQTSFNQATSCVFNYLFLCHFNYLIKAISFSLCKYYYIIFSYQIYSFKYTYPVVIHSVILVRIQLPSEHLTRLRSLTVAVFNLTPNSCLDNSKQIRSVLFQRKLIYI